MESVEELNNPNIKDRVSRADRLRPLVAEMDNVRSRFNTRLLLDEKDSALIYKHLDNNTLQVRDDIIDVLVKVSPVNQTGPLDHYHSMGLDFIPENTDRTHPLIQVRKETPNNPIPDLPVLVLLRNALDKRYSNIYGSQHSSGSRAISLFKRGAIEKQSHTRNEMIKEIVSDGRLPVTETIKVHETAHCSNAFSFDYRIENWNIAQEIKQQILKSRHSPSGYMMYELHSMLSEYCLTGQNSSRELNVSSVRDMAKYAMRHPSVSGHRAKGIEEREISKMVRGHLDGNTEDLPDWYNKQHKKAEIVLRNILRTIVVEKTLGRTGTILGRQRNKEYMVKVTDGRMLNWEKRIVRSAQQKGIIGRDLSLEDALVELDDMAEDIIDSLDQCALQVQLSLFAGVAVSVGGIDSLSDKTRNVLSDARLLIEEAKSVGN